MGEARTVHACPIFLKNTKYRMGVHMGASHVGRGGMVLGELMWGYFSSRTGREGCFSMDVEGDM